MKDQSIARGRHKVRALVVLAAIVAGLAFASPASALTANEKYVTKLYVDFAGRPPTSSELAWRAAVLGGGTSRNTYVSQLFASSPMQQAWITANYYQYLSVAPTSGQLSAAQTTLSSANNYLGTELDILGATQYFNAAGATNDTFLREIYNDVLFREPDSSGLSYYLGQLNSGAHTRRWVADSLIRSNGSASIRTKGISGPTDCISTNVQDPDDGGSGSFCLVLDRMADPSGASYWTAQLAGTDQLPSLWTGLAASTEYYNLAQI